MRDDVGRWIVVVPQVGSDISVWVEVRTDGRYQAIRPDGSIAVPLTSAYGLAETRANGQWSLQRDYYAFALLDGRRQPWPFPPVIPARGIPPDPSECVAQAVAADDEVDSPSWCTLDEFLALDWETPVPHVATVYFDEEILKHIEDPEAFDEHVARTGRVPRIWHGRPVGVAEPMPTDAYDEPAPRGLRSTRPLRQVVPDLYEFIQALRTLGPDPMDIRFIYWFDQLFGSRQTGI